VSEEVTRVERVAHWQKLCKADCSLCWSQAHKEQQDRASWFTNTGMTLQVGAKVQPVMKNERGRLFVGETLGPLNTAGRGGRVWTAMDLETLKYNVNFRQPEEKYDS
jgi:hypothetical protein